MKVLVAAVSPDLPKLGSDRSGKRSAQYGRLDLGGEGERDSRPRFEPGWNDDVFAAEAGGEVTVTELENEKGKGRREEGGGRREEGGGEGLVRNRPLV